MARGWTDRYIIWQSGYRSGNRNKLSAFTPGPKEASRMFAPPSMQVFIPAGVVNNRESGWACHQDDSHG
jgi:hypothetical protein